MVNANDMTSRLEKELAFTEKELAGYVFEEGEDTRACQKDANHLR